MSFPNVQHLKLYEMDESADENFQRWLSVRATNSDVKPLVSLDAPMTYDSMRLVAGIYKLSLKNLVIERQGQLNPKWLPLVVELENLEFLSVRTRSIPEQDLIAWLPKLVHLRRIHLIKTRPPRVVVFGKVQTGWSKELTKVLQNMPNMERVKLRRRIRNWNAGKLHL